MNEPSFFVGYAASLPADTKSFLLKVAAGWVFLMGALALTLSVATDDPGDGHFAGDAVLTGLVTNAPYPVLFLPPDAGHPLGHAVLLAGDGKTGAQSQSLSLEGKRAKASGYMLKRGELDMLVLGAVSAEPAAEPSASFNPAPLGRWRVTGEICDGKCYTGGMRPGTGLAHKACANLCIAGGAPPVFVSAAPVEGSIFLLMAGPDGGPAPQGIADLAGLPVQVEGDIERRGDLLVLKADWARAKEE